MKEISKKVKIIYIIGTGRNGSTMLDVLLGNSQKIQSTGEQFNTISAWRANKVCSCSKAVSECTFWSEVKKLFEKTFEGLELKNMPNTLKCFERDILSPLNLVFNNIVCPYKIKQYKRFLKELYTAISIVSKKPILVDSSKNAFRGYALLNVFKENVYFIHLVRDGRGQMWSWIKAGKIPPFNIPIKKNDDNEKIIEGQYYWWVPWLYSISWVIYNLLAFFVIRIAGPKKSIRIQYEDFMKDPSFHIKRISDLVNEDLSDLDNLLLSKEPLRMGHIISGNRLRMSKQIVIKLPDEEWKTRLFAKYKVIFWIVTGWLARIYGYKFKN